MASTNSLSSTFNAQSGPPSRCISPQAPLQSSDLPAAAQDEDKTNEDLDYSSSQSTSAAALAPGAGSALQVKWTFEKDAKEGVNEDEDSNLAMLDIVVIPGIHSSGNELSEESSDNWVRKYLESFASGSRLIMFDWDPIHLFSGTRARDSTQSQARRLLDGLSNDSGEKSMRRSIMFVADDLGSMVLKQALTMAATSNATSLLDIVDRTRALVFRGCPHRSVDQREMEDKLAEFVLGARTAQVSSAFTARPTLVAIPGLAEAVIQTNGLFILAKIPVKCSLVTIHHGGRYDVGKVHSVFDEFVGTFGLPFERRIHTETGGLLDHLENLKKAGIWPDEKNAEWMTPGYERTLMSLSSLITPFRTPPIEQWSLHQDVENFIEWRDTHSTDVLCVYGDSDLQETSEQLFYVLDQQRSRGPGHGEVLYFSFNRHDTTHNTLKDMLATFIAQMICHCTNWMRLMAHSMFVQFSEERGWTDQDLLQWFDACSNLLLTSSAYLVIHGFDECSDSNRKAFIDWFDHMTAAREQPWKLAFTSQQPLQLDSAQISMSNWRHINMAGSHHNASLDFVRSIERKSMVLRHRPEVFLEYDNLLESIDLIAQGDKLIQEIVLAHALSVPGWPQTHSLEDIFGPLPHHLSSEGTLMFTLDHVLRRLSAKENVRTLLLWLLYSARPLSLWELVSVARPDCVNNGDASPQPDIMRGFTQMCETQLRGIVDIRDTQVCFRHPGLRELLRKSISRSSDAYIWNDLDESKVNYDITETCLRFLARDDVQQELEFRAHETILGEMPRYGLASGYTNFCSYAAYYWPRHAKAALSRGSLDISSLLENYKQPALTAAWMKYFWCLSNPVTRSKEPLESLDALLAGLGLLNALGGLPDLDARNIIFAAQEAAARRSSKLVKKLLYRCEQPNSEELVDILKAAASSGSEKLVLDVFQHITNTISDKGAVRWPPCLLYRAAWMGMDQFAGQLLEAGCLSADPGGPMAEKPRISPLHLAVRHGHTACIKTLLSHGADTGFLALSNRNVLFSAANSGRAEVFEILFEMGRQSLTDKDKNDETPLEFAASCGLKAAVKSLLRMGADPYDGKDISAADVGWLPLINAASRGRTECIRILLDHDADPNQPGPGGEDTAIYFAVGNNFPSTLRVLLERGADPNHHLLWKIPPIAQVVLATKWENGPGIPLADKIKMIDMLIEFKGRVDATDSEGRTALMDAIRAGDESIVAHLLELGASVHSMDSYKQSPLHYVPATGSEAILKMILAKGPDLDHLNNDGCSPLRLSVRFANMVSILLEHGAKPDLSDHEGYTPLMVAATWGHYESVKLLLDHHADVNLRSVEADGTGVTAVFWAAEDDHPDIVKMLADAGANLSHKYRAGLTALHVASPAAAAVLLQYRKRLDIDASADLNGSKWTPLHRAIYSHKSMELVKLLVNNGASLQALDRDGDTPLGLAVIAKNHEAVKILLREEDCDLKIASHRGRTPLHYATDHETMETLQLLVERGADVNQTAKSAYGSPLQKACQNNKMGQAMIEFLLEKGADLHARGGTLGFAISSAALYGTSEIIGLLLQRGATVNVQDDMGRKPIHLSCMGGADNFQEIYDAGGNQHLQDKDNLGRTAFHWAAQHGQPEILEKLIAELGTSLLDKPDVDGWTPLMWTCLPHFNSEEDADEGRKRRKRVFQMLIEQGARPNAIGKIGDTWWSLRDIMVYNDIDRECLALVDKALATVQPTVTSVTTEAGQARRIGALKSEGSWECDACYCSIRGLRRTCQECYVDLCNKCYWHRDLVHDHGCGATEWEEVGPEFEEAPVESSGEEKAGEGAADGDKKEEDNSDKDSVWSKDSNSSSD